MVSFVLGTFLSVLLFPFHLLFRAMEWLGRLTALILGFMMMVLGVALSVGPAALVGIPLFAVGLIVTMRSLDR